MAEYNTVAGLVQFEPDVRQWEGQEIRSVSVVAIGSGGKSVKIALWPEKAHIPVGQGDFIVAHGKFESRNVDGKEYLNLSARDVVVVPASYKVDLPKPGEVKAEKELLF